MFFSTSAQFKIKLWLQLGFDCVKNCCSVQLYISSKIKYYVHCMCMLLSYIYVHFFGQCVNKNKCQGLNFKLEYNYKHSDSSRHNNYGYWIGHLISETLKQQDTIVSKFGSDFSKVSSILCETLTTHHFLHIPEPLRHPAQTVLAPKCPYVYKVI